MDHSPSPFTRLTVPLEGAFVGVATAFAENSALALGLKSRQAMALTLAVEEVFTYLSQAAPTADSLELSCRAGGYYVALDLVLPAAQIDLRALNLTFQVRPEDQDSLAQMGLLIAARSLDRLDVERDSSGALRFCLVKEKAYPPSAPGREPVPRALEKYAIRHPRPAELKWITRLLAHGYPPHLVPSELRQPGRLVDMAAAGEWRVLAAVDSAGYLGGALAWTGQGERTVLCQGPYLFGQPAGSAMAVDLVEALLGELARSQALILLNHLPTPELPAAYFEPLGSYTLYPPDDSPREVTVQFRHLAEDPGTTVWAHPALEAFLDEQYQGLFLARQVLGVRAEGEDQPPHSVLSTRLHRAQGQATLRPLQEGRDAADNLAAHVELLRGEGLRTIFFEMDLGQAWQADFTPALLDQGFSPRLLVPYGASSDMILWQSGPLA